MKQQLVELERIHFTRVFPWVHLFKSFRIALDIRKMTLGALALLLLSGGYYMFSYLPLEFTQAEVRSLREPPWNFQPLVENRTLSPILDHLNHSAALLARPVLSVWQPARDLVEETLTWSGAALRWTQILWALCLWSFFGTAISRMAAVQFAVDERVSLKEAGRFAGSKWLWALSAPLMPLVGVLALWLGLFVFGLIGRIPGIGLVIVGILWIIPLLLALGMLLLFIGMGFGWPLMVATISTQGSDAYDGFSRSFDYVYSRFWHLVWFVIVAVIHGLLTLGIVIGAVILIMHLAGTFVGAGMGKAIYPGRPSTGSPFTVWLYTVLMLLAGYAASYFWTASTIIYFLLRQSEDANHLSEVYRPKEDASDHLVQLAGMAASAQPIIERPAKHPSETDPEPRPGSEPDS